MICVFALKSAPAFGALSVFDCITAWALSPYGLGCPQLLQNFPELTVPHCHVQSDAGAGFPQLLQNFPVLTEPHSHVQEFAGAAV